jgi:23S rRNA (uracil1939-C5)-methyltransferase
VIARGVIVEAIAAGGDGVARIDGLVTFIPRTAPGDVVDVVLEPRGRFARGRLLRVVTSSSARVVPRCKHYLRDSCGGCQLQHLEYGAQLAAKRQIVGDALLRIGRQPVEVPAVVPSPEPWEYRNRLTLTIQLAPDGSRRCGLHRYDVTSEIFDLEECPIAHPKVSAACGEIRRAAHLLPPARQLRATVRLHADRTVLVLEGPGRWRRDEAFRRACPSLAEVIWRSGKEVVSGVGADADEIGGEATAFEQVNPAVARLLRQLLLGWALESTPATVVEAYCGTGAVAAALSEHGVGVVGIERDRAAAAIAAVRLGQRGRIVAAPVEDTLAATLPADVVILNPPRAGLTRRVAEILWQADPPPAKILYVSCDPATLARDVQRLAGYQVRRLTCFDMFPQTAHVETVCELVFQGR